MTIGLVPRVPGAIALVSVSNVVPANPTLTIPRDPRDPSGLTALLNSDKSITATISGSSDGSTNVVSETNNGVTWVPIATRIGDGEVTFTLTSERYWVEVQSSF